jgi:hypothetical protein
MKSKKTVLRYGVCVIAAAALCACAPADGIDYEVFGPDGFMEHKVVYFDNITSFKQTENDESVDNRIYDYQRGGSEGPMYGISVMQDHTAELLGAAAGIKGKSFRWSNKTSLDQRVKFDRMFTPADIGNEYYISMWVYSTAPAKVRIGAFSLSGRLKATLWATSPREKSQDILIDTGWNEIVWAGYVHQDIQITQLGFEQTGGTVVDEFYLDDIVMYKR